MPGTQHFSYHANKNSLYCSVKDEGKYYSVDLLHVISARQIVLYYKENVLTGLHYPVILIVCNKGEIISTFNNKNLINSWCMSPVVPFFITTHIS